MTHVESFQCEAQKVLHQELSPDFEQLQQLLDTGSNLDVELPEIPKLKQVCKCITALPLPFTSSCRKKQK